MPHTKAHMKEDTKKRGKKTTMKKTKKKGGWIAHVKKVAKQKGIKYGEALKVASKSYKKK